MWTLVHRPQQLKQQQQQLLLQVAGGGKQAGQQAWSQDCSHQAVHTELGAAVAAAAVLRDGCAAAARDAEGEGGQAGTRYSGMQRVVQEGLSCS